MRVRLVVAYDGTNYHGWQIQNNAISVEEVLQNALRELLCEPVELIGASRTDAGVHAAGKCGSIRYQIPESRQKRLQSLSIRGFRKISV